MTHGGHGPTVIRSVLSQREHAEDAFRAKDFIESPPSCCDPPVEEKSTKESNRMPKGHCNYIEVGTSRTRRAIFRWKVHMLPATTLKVQCTGVSISVIVLFFTRGTCGSYSTCKQAQHVDTLSSCVPVHPAPLLPLQPIQLFASFASALIQTHTHSFIQHSFTRYALFLLCSCESGGAGASCR